MLVSAGACRPALGSRTRSDWGLEPEPLRSSLAELRWRIPLAVTTDLDANPQNRGTPVFDAARGVVYFGALDHGVYAVRASDGAVLWRFQTLGAVEGEGIVNNGTLYIGSSDGALYALDAVTGRMRWRLGTIAQIFRAPVVTQDSVYFVNADDSVFAVNRADGVQRWRYRREPPGGITGSGHAGLLYVRGRLHTGFSDGHIVALSPSDGSVVWDRDTATDTESAEGANEAHRLIDVDTTPVWVEETIFAASYTAGLYALDPEGGGVRWRLERVTDIAALATDGRDLYATSSTLGLLRIDPTDGRIVYARSFATGGLGDLVAAQGLLFVPSASQSLWVVRARDGEPLEGLGHEGVSGQPAVAFPWLFFSTNMGVAYGMRLAVQAPD